MAKILVLYHSSFGHILEMAEAVAEGARASLGQVDIRRVPELVPDEIARKSGHLLDQPHSFVRVEDLPRYDAIMIGAGSRLGRMAWQMANFLEQAGGLGASGALVGKVGSAFTSAARHGGQETALIAIHASLMHFGMVCVGLPPSLAGQARPGEITGASPYGASTVAGSDGSRRPSADELDAARFQGRHVAEIAHRLFPAGEGAPAADDRFVLAD